MVDENFKAQLKRLGLAVCNEEMDILEAQVADIATMTAYLNDRLTFHHEPSNLLRLREYKPSAPAG